MHQNSLLCLTLISTSFSRHFPMPLAHFPAPSWCRQWYRHFCLHIVSSLDIIETTLRTGHGNEPDHTRQVRFQADTFWSGLRFSMLLRSFASRQMNWVSFESTSFSKGLRSSIIRPGITYQPATSHGQVKIWSGSSGAGKKLTNFSTWVTN